MPAKLQGRRTAAPRVVDDRRVEGCRRAQRVGKPDEVPNGGEACTAVGGRQTGRSIRVSGSLWDGWPDANASPLRVARGDGRLQVWPAGGGCLNAPSGRSASVRRFAGW